MDMSSDIDRHCNDPDEDVVQSIDSITSEFNRRFDLEHNNDDQHDHEQHEEEEYNDDDFTFMFIGEDDTSIDADNAFENGQIRQVFPLFDQKLLLDGEYEVEEIDRLPFQPPVDKIFVESPRGFPASENEQNDDEAAGPYCAWSKESVTGNKAELTKKSNSTGFSKLWRLKEKVNRSNSDGRDTFVFLKSSDRTVTSASSSSSTAKAVTGNGISNGTFVKVNGKSKVVKTKKAVSAHEVYLRNKGSHTEEERRRSYLPYRPELMGFFTNVHGGLSKNVHPY